MMNGKGLLYNDMLLNITYMFNFKKYEHIFLFQDTRIHLNHHRTNAELFKKE